MENNTQARKWALTINNPQEAGLDHETIKEELHKLSLDYFCISDEIATTGTYHTHVFLYSKSPIRFSTLKNRFPTAHIEKAYGNVQDNRDYIAKTGKWANTDKAETSVPGTFEEWGDVPPEKAEKYPQMFSLVQDIQEGMSTADIIIKYPNMAFHIRDIDLLRQTLLADKFSVENRAVEVSYLYGATGAGKTRSIFEAHGARNICRITSYSGTKGVLFDGYHGQDVLVFEEFAGQVSLEAVLSFIDIYPVELPARYNNRVACYTKVYLTSNLPLKKQYRLEQINKPETWKAFLRRIHNVIEFLPDGTTIIHKGGRKID